MQKHKEIIILLSFVGYDFNQNDVFLYSLPSYGWKSTLLLLHFENGNSLLNYKRAQ